MSERNDLVNIDANGIVTTIEPSMFELIAEVARDKDFDADKMRAMIDMKNAEDDRSAKKAHTRALVEFKKHPPRIIKNATSHMNKYATIDSVMRQLDQPLNEVGLVLTWEIDTNPELVAVVCVLSHVDGYSTTSTYSAAPDTTGKKSPAQGQASIVTYGKRYTALAVLGLAEQGEDDDGAAEAAKQGIGGDMVKTLEALIKETSADLISLCKHFKVGTLNEMSNSQFGIAINRLNAKKRVQDNANS